MHEAFADNLPASLLARAHQRGADVALRHKRLGLWQARSPVARLCTSASSCAQLRACHRPRLLWRNATSAPR